MAEDFDLGATVQSAAAKHGVDARLLNAVIHQESGGNPNAVSPKGAVGLMQLMPKTAESLGVEDAFDPIQNVDGGTRYLKQLLDKYKGDRTKALAAYNAGPGAVDAAGGIPNIPETQNYVKSIMTQLGDRGVSQSLAERISSMSGDRQSLADRIAAIAGNVKPTAPTVPTAPTGTDIAKSAGKEFVQTSPLALLGLGKDIVTHYGKQLASGKIAGPEDLLMDAAQNPENPLYKVAQSVWQSHVNEKNQAVDKWKQMESAVRSGDYLEAGAAASELLGHTAGMIVPVVGPAAAEEGEKIGKGTQKVKSGKAMGGEEGAREVARGEEELAAGAGGTAGLLTSVLTPERAPKAVEAGAETAGKVTGVIKKGVEAGKEFAQEKRTLVKEGKPLSKATEQRLTTAATPAEAGTALRESVERVSKERGEAVETARQAALQHPSYLLDAGEGSNLHADLKDIQAKVDAELSGKFKAERLDKVSQRLKEALPDMPKEEDFTVKDPKTGKIDEAKSAEKFEDAMAKYDEETTHSGTATEAWLNQLQDDINEAELSKNGRASSYLKSIKEAVTNRAVEAAPGDTGTAWRKAREAYRDVKEQMGEQRGGAASPGAKVLKTSKRGVEMTPEARFKALAKGDATTVKDVYRNMEPEEIANTEDALFDNLRKTSREGGKPSAKQALANFEKDLEANKARYPNKFEDFHKVLKYDALRESAVSKVADWASRTTRYGLAYETLKYVLGKRHP